jgi:lipopolysaccharide biosynthesis glycosyltransferase
MKWFFCWCQDTDFRSDHNWKDLIRVSVESALRNTSLEPNFIYDGEPSDFTEELAKKGVKIFFHRLSFTKKITDCKPEDKEWQAIARGAFLRFDIPILADSNDEFVLYTDADVMFLRDPDFSGYHPNFIAATSQSIRGSKSDFNSGVMLFNLKAFKLIYNNLIEFTVKSPEISSGSVFDQEILIFYLKNNYLLLPENYNWKPYWGLNQEASIIHWHGPKPETINKLLTGEIKETHQIWMHLYEKNPSSYKYYADKHKFFLRNYYGSDKNIALDKPATQSSVSQWSTQPTRESDAAGAVNGVINGVQGFHTDIEDSPWWMVDLGDIFAISEIYIFNRTDLPPEIPQRASRLAIEIGTDAGSFTEVYRRESDEPFGGVDGNPLIWTSPLPVVGRYVRIRLLTRNYLHLDQVEVFGKPAGDDRVGFDKTPIPLPEDFDPDRYLELNPDVREGGADPVRHWQEYGYREGRQWK